MDDNTTNLLATIAAIVGLSAGYAKYFGAYQTVIVQWVIDAFGVVSRLRGLVNLLVGIAIAGAFSAFAAWQAGDPGVLVLGLLAGALASVEAAKVHDGRGTLLPLIAESTTPAIDVVASVRQDGD